MTARTDPPAADNAAGGEPRPNKPRFSLMIATAFGLGYVPKAPGTWGSLAGLAISLAVNWLAYARIFRERGASDVPLRGFWDTGFLPGYFQIAIAVFIAIVGVWTSDRIARHTGIKDPQYVVIDEVSGQFLVFSLPFVVLNWKSWLLGLILFRVFDIWKPFPARQAESLPGGWGIMADDWVAGIYAALCLWLARAAGF